MSKQRTITQEDIDANPIITELGGVVGDITCFYSSEEYDIKLVPVTPPESPTE